MTLNEYVLRIYNRQTRLAFRNWLGMEASEDQPLAWWVNKFRRFARWVMDNED